MNQIDSESSERVLHWYQCRPVVTAIMGLIFVGIVCIAAARAWYQHRVVDHVESHGAFVMLKVGYAYVGVDSRDDLSTFLKETKGDLRYLARRGSLSLVISGSVSTTDLRQLSNVGGFSSIHLRNCKASEEGVEQLRQSLPYCNVYWEAAADGY